MPRDAQSNIVGDTGFSGMVDRLNPANLQAGEVSDAENARFRNGVAETRRGITKPACYNNINPEVGTDIDPWGEIHGVGRFQNSIGIEFIIIAADGKTYYSRQNNNNIEVPLPTGMIIEDNVTFTQAFGKLLMHRGKFMNPLVMADLDTGFVDVTEIWDSAKDYESGDRVSYGPTFTPSFTASTTLYSSLDDSATVVVVNSAAAWTDSGVITVGSEEILYGSITAMSEGHSYGAGEGGVYLLGGCTRGYNSTTAAAHSASAGVTVVGHAITRSGTTAKITFNAETGFRSGMEIFITGATQTEYNGRFKLTETANGVNQYTFTVSGTPATPATGTIVATQNFYYWEANTDPTTGDEPGVSANWTQKYDAMPNSESGVYLQGRLAVPTSYNIVDGTYDSDVSVVQFSDVLDISKSYYDQGFQIERGSDRGAVKDLHVLSENQLLIFKEASVHVMTGVKVQTVNATFADSVVLETLIPHYGIVAPRAKAAAGDDVYFFSSKRGVVSLKRNQQGKVHGVDIPLSEPIQKLVDSIDHRYYDKIRMESWDNCLYVAAPRNNSYCDVCFCYDFITQSWSYYTGEAVNIKEFFISKWNGRDRLFFTSNDGFVNLMEEGFATDDVRDTTSTQNINIADINFSITTRGYTSQDTDHRSYDSLSVNLETWNPKFTIKVKPDGVDEETTLCENKTKSRTQYFRPFDSLPYDISNRDGNHNTAYREDYSVVAPNNTDAYLQTEEGDYIHLESGSRIGSEDWVPNWSLSGTVYLDRMQEWIEKFKYTPERGRYLQVTITNTQGRIKVDDVSLANRSTGHIYQNKV